MVKVFINQHIDMDSLDEPTYIKSNLQVIKISYTQDYLMNHKYYKYSIQNNTYESKYITKEY